MRRAMACLVALAATAAANAAPITGLTSYTSQAVHPNADNQDHSLGWRFTVNTPVTLSALGYNYFNENYSSNHLVGIYNTSGTLLASATVTNASTVYNGYRYTNLGSPLTLAAGDYYIVGTTRGLNDDWVFEATNIVTDPRISYVGSFFTSGTGGTLGFPSNPASDREYLVANFQFAEVPEPISMVVFGTLLVGGAGVALRRRMTAKA